MNEKNVEHLKNQIRSMGFGIDHIDQLKRYIIRYEVPEFTLMHHQNYGTDNTASALQFKKSENSDIYYFNRYDMVLKKDQQTDPVKQTFYINNKDSNITLKEAYNLMSGRSVHKEFSMNEVEKYRAWFQLDFNIIDKNGNYETKKFHQNYEFELKQTIAKHQILDIGLTEDNKVRLIGSLERGNLQSIVFAHEGKEQKIFIEADPQVKNVNFYDANMKIVSNESLEKNPFLQLVVSNALKKAEVTDKKKDVNQEFMPIKPKVENKNDKTLLPKKREHTRKGLGIA